MKTDITNYSDEELSLNFLNDEGLYNEMMYNVKRCRPFADLQYFIDDLFIYTSEQLEDMEETYSNEIAEYYEE